MKTHTYALSILLVGLMTSPILSAETVDILGPASGDLSAAQLRTPVEGKTLPTISTERVTFAWALPADQAIDLLTEPHRATSREYSLSVTAADLEAGVTLPLTAPGALVRLNPAGPGLGATAIDPASLILVDPQGSDHVNGEGMLSPADAEAIKAAGAPFAEGTSAFCVDPALGAGAFTLRLAGTAVHPDAAYAIHVFERSSPITLEVETDRSAYLEGGTFRATFVLDGAAGLVIDSVEGRLVAPSGQAVPVRILHRGDTDFVAAATLKAAPTADLGLWEVHASIVGRMDGAEIRRDVHTAFAVATPCARFLGHAEVTRQEGLAIELPVETAAPGRYEARGILFGTDSSGALRPLGIAHAAVWMPQGVNTLSLDFDTEMLNASGLAAPFELRDLQLLDQGRMGQLHRQARALELK